MVPKSLMTEEHGWDNVDCGWNRVTQKALVKQCVEKALTESTEWVKFGPLGRDAYPAYALSKIEKKFGESGNPAGLQARAELWEHYRQLETTLGQCKNGDVVRATYAFVKGLNGFVRDQLENTPEGGLGLHLKNATLFAKAFLLTENGQSRFPQILSTQQAHLLAEVAAPMHDVLKFLGRPDAQVTPDHEIIGCQFAQHHLPGGMVDWAGKPYRLSKEDATFVAEVIGDHENLEKEVGRREFITSDAAAERAKALFFVIDVLAGVLVPGRDGRFTIDSNQLRARFTDLYFRHIDLVAGKIFRPQWGAFTIGDLTRTLGVLGEHGLKLASSTDGRNPPEILIDAALDAIGMARAANDQRQDNKLSPAQLAAIQASESQLKDLRREANCN